MNNTIVVLVGPTGSGKTAASLRIAHELDGEIVSADSMQLYRGMDIGTAKLMTDQREGIPHHMIDVSEPDEPLTVSQYQHMALNSISDILSRGKIPIICGGSGLYVNALTHDLSFGERTPPSEATRRMLEELSNEDAHAILTEMAPDAAARIHPNNRVRVIRALEIALAGGFTNTEYDFEKPNAAFEFVIAGIAPERELLRARLDERIDTMLSNGLLEEVGRLKERFPESRVLSQAIGYKELLNATTSDDIANGIASIRRNTKRFAKRQMTWFRRDERIVWFRDGNDSMLDHVVSRCRKGAGKCYTD